MKVWWKYLRFSGSEIAKLVQQLVMGWRVQGSIPGAGKGFSVLQNLSRLALGALLVSFNGYWGSSGAMKRPGHGIDHPPTNECCT